jgi:putative peptidoglycan lipid II flippase
MALYTMQKLKQLLNSANSVKGASVILVVTLLLSNILGMVRDHYIAQKIPTTLLDAYYAAFRLPDLIFNLLVLGAIAAAFIPVFTTYISKKEEKKAWHVTNSFLNISILVLAIFSIILALLMPYIIPFIVPDFGPDKQELTVKLARLMLISPIFFSISYTLGGILNSYKRFFVYSIAPLIYNLCIILATLFLTEKFSVYGIVIGVLVGAFLHMAIQIPVTLKLGYRYKPAFDWKDNGVKKIFLLMIPRSIGLGATQVMLLVYTSIASTLAAGSVAIYNLADNIQTMPVVVFGISFATALFPNLSEAISLKDTDKFVGYICKGIRSILYLLIPSGIGIILIRTQIVRLILGSGYFGWEQTVNTADTLGYLAISLFSQGIVALLARAFYALHDTKIPMISSIISIIISIVLGYVLVPIMGITGLGLAYSVGSIINALFLYTILRKKETKIRNNERSAIVFIFKILIASAAMIAIVQFSKNIIGLHVDMSRFWGVLIQTVLTVGFGSGVYILVTYLLGLEEIKEIFGLIKKRFTFSRE